MELKGRLVGPTRNNPIGVLTDLLFSMKKWDCMDTYHSRFIERIVFNEWITDGEDPKAEKVHAEHVVPLIFLTEALFEKIRAGASVEDIHFLLMKNLRVINIDKEKARLLDGPLGLKTKMPEGWRLGIHCPFDRLRLVYEDIEKELGVELEPDLVSVVKP